MAHDYVTSNWRGAGGLEQNAQLPPNINEALYAQTAHITVLGRAPTKRPPANATERCKTRFNYLLG